MLVTDDVAGQLSELDLTGSTFEANVDFFSLQRFQNIRTLRLAQCRKLTDGGPVGERHTGGTGQEPRLEVLDLSECPSIKGMDEVVLEMRWVVGYLCRNGTKDASPVKCFPQISGAAAG